MQLQVWNSPFDQEQVALLNRVLPTLTESQKVWLSGYLAASQFSSILKKTEEMTTELSAQGMEKSSPQAVTILYGSQTGNAQGLAKKAATIIEGIGYQVFVSSMNDFKQNNFKKIHILIMIVSTHGEGEPPDNARSLHEFLHGKRAPKLLDLRFSVLSLGDSSYELFCQTGKEFDSRLEELGGTRIYPRIDCDLDYDERADEWMKGVVGSLRGEERGSLVPKPESAQIASETEYSRNNPFTAEILENISLNGLGSNKETRHLELSLEGSGLTFEPGDSLGIYPKNEPDLVKLLIDELVWDPDEEVTVNKQGDVHKLKDALLSFYEITVLTKPLLEKVNRLTSNNDLRELLSAGNKQKLKAYLVGRDLLDLIRDFGPWGRSAQEFVSILRKMPARLYSIASSLLANQNEVHLTISAVRYEAHGRERKGVCSILAAERLQPGDTLPVYIQHNENFKLPENPQTSIIMVGPGTGVAPFRSFLQEREELKAKGKTWLFFGDQHFVTDFLYQTEWQKWLKDGVLTKMDIAFSRDRGEKVYVQHRMRAQSKELFEWLQTGAYLYICGDEQHMAHDVHNTLLAIIAKEGGMSLEQAEAYIAEMKQQKRYQRDVY